jgi:hypothetical protein
MPGHRGGPPNVKTEGVIVCCLAMVTARLRRKRTLSIFCHKNGYSYPETTVIFTKLHDVKSQKTVMFTITAVSTSDLQYLSPMEHILCTISTDTE